MIDRGALVAADFLGEEVVQRHMDRYGRDTLLRKIQTASSSNSELAHSLKVYGEDIINAVGAEVVSTATWTLCPLALVHVLIDLRRQATLPTATWTPCMCSSPMV